MVVRQGVIGAVGSGPGTSPIPACTGDIDFTPGEYTFTPFGAVLFEQSDEDAAIDAGVRLMLQASAMRWSTTTCRRRQFSTALGTGVGALTGDLEKRLEEKQSGSHLEEWLTWASPAIVVIVGDLYLDGVGNAITRSANTPVNAADSGEYDNVKQAVDEAPA